MFLVIENAISNCAPIKKSLDKPSLQPIVLESSPCRRKILVVSYEEVLLN